MRTQRALAAALVVIVGAVTATTVTTPVRAHEDGKVELYVAELAVVGVADDGDHRLDALVVDRDSGVGAPGFAVTVTASGAGTTREPVELTSTSAGHYVGSVRLEPGQWNLTLHADQGASAVPAKASTRTFAVMVATDGSTTVDGGDDGDGSAAWLIAVLVAAAMLVAGGVIALWRRGGRQP